MELRQLEHFIAVAEESSFTKAAQRLGVVQSTLSVSVRTLEAELDARLLERTTHRVRLTDAGRALLAEARNALSAVDAARDAVAAVQGGARGTVRVGIMNSLRLVDLASALTRYHRERPLVQIVPSTAVGGSVELVAGVLDGTFDLAFTALPGPYPPGLAVRPLASEPLLLACPDDHRLAGRTRVALAELNGERFVDFPLGWGTRAVVDRMFEQAGLRRETAVEVSDVPTAVELVRAGFGCAFLTESLTAGAGPVALRPVDPAAVFEVSLVTPTGRRLSAAAAGLVDLLTSSDLPAAAGQVAAVVLAGGPGGEQGEVVVRGRSRLGGVGDHRQPGFGGQLEVVVEQRERADDRVAEVLDAARVRAHVVPGPELAEGVAAGGQLADEVGQGAVERIGGGPEVGDEVVGDVLPVGPELAGAGVEEGEPGYVRRRFARPCGSG